MTGVEGGLRVSLFPSQGRVARVGIASDRALAACRVLEGRNVNDALALLPMLFSLCGTAQFLAGRKACESALEVFPSAEIRTRRRLALLAETLCEHATGILRDWPRFLAEAPALAQARAIRGALEPLKSIPLADLSAAMVADHIATARALVETHILGRLGGDALTGEDGFTLWTERAPSGAARLCGAMETTKLAGLGRCEQPFLPAQLHRLLLDHLMQDESYLARPHWHGSPAETGPLTRRADHPLIAALLKRHGNGVLTRLAARLADLMEVLAEMESLAAHAHAGAGAGAGAASKAQPDLPLAGSGIGLGIVEAARGRLAHRVVIENGIVRKWRILAPTEWNFHPDGAFARGLVGLEMEDSSARAELLALAIDPCVACQINHARPETCDA